MPKASSNQTRAGSKTKELRLGLVCYGGVSLAIYIHGVTKELHKLVVASKAFEETPVQNPFEESRVEYVYWEILKKLEKKDGGVRTRVVIDVIAGTSAGGINGIFLAKALAHNLSQDQLRDLWMQKADMNKLMGGKKSIPLPLKLVWFVARKILQPKRTHSPIDGNLMFTWLYEALEDMRQAGGALSEFTTLMPKRHSLELFVTITDFYGYFRFIPVQARKPVEDLRHRHVLKFTYEDEGGDQLGSAYDPALTFAARATSSFPGAFPPINISNVTENLGPHWSGRERFNREFFRIYELSGARAQDSYFVDGGVLDNFPFGHAITAIIKKPAAFQVDRRLLYIQPDPGEPSRKKNSEMPGMLETIVGGASKIPSHEPILDDLHKIRAFNERVRKVNEIIQLHHPRVAETLKALGAEMGLLEKLDQQSLSQLHDTIHEEAKDHCGFVYAGYLQLKLLSVVEQISRELAKMCDFPADSDHAFFIKEAMEEWARERGLLSGKTVLSDDQLAFLKIFDFNFAQRRIRFIIHRINRLYDKAETEGYPSREQLNGAKEKLYELIHELDTMMDAKKIDKELCDEIGTLFDKNDIRNILKDPCDNAKTYASANAEKISQVSNRLGLFLKPQREGFRGRLYEAFRSITQDWKNEIKEDLIIRYFGFPFWDVFIFPLRMLTDLGELDPIEVVRMSPDDVSLLKKPKGMENKLKGIVLGHFGAFFKRSDRENDYLWGRLDSAERLMHMLAGELGTSYCKKAFKAILHEERSNLTKTPELFEELETQIAHMQQ